MTKADLRKVDLTGSKSVESVVQNVHFGNERGFEWENRDLLVQFRYLKEISIEPVFDMYYQLQEAS